jgi:hypothetical protein
MMHLTSFCLGVVVTGLMFTKGWFNEFIYLLLSSAIILLVSFVYNYIRGIDYMQEHHPDYKGEDLFDEGETESKL